MAGSGGVNLTKVYCKHIWKCHMETPLNNQYMVIKMLKQSDNPIDKGLVMVVMSSSVLFYSLLKLQNTPIELL
jgi:hypothetical protein